MHAIAAAAPVPLEIPPRIFNLLGGHFTAFDAEAASLSARFPVKHDYRNPLGFMQGGMIIAAIDNTMGPLCFLCGFLGVSTQINTTFVRPVTPTEQWVDVDARIVERTATLAQVSATAANGAGKAVVLCQATFALARP
ncbi:MAG: PaaI family thioesterase [Gammaproteobacteria bacterium]